MKSFISLLCLAFCFVACDDIIEVEDISEKEVIMLAPINNAILDTIAVTFTWEALEDAEQYHLQIATPNFENAQQIVKDSVLVVTSFFTSLDTKDYEWRIRAENSGYSTKYSQQRFKIEE